MLTPAPTEHVRYIVISLPCTTGVRCKCDHFLHVGVLVSNFARSQANGSGDHTNPRNQDRSARAKFRTLVTLNLRCARIAAETSFYVPFR